MQYKYLVVLRGSLNIVVGFQNIGRTFQVQKVHLMLALGELSIFDSKAEVTGDRISHTSYASTIDAAQAILSHRSQAPI